MCQPDSASNSGTRLYGLLSTYRPSSSPKAFKLSRAREILSLTPAMSHSTSGTMTDRGFPLKQEGRLSPNPTKNDGIDAKKPTPITNRTAAAIDPASWTLKPAVTASATGTATTIQATPPSKVAK